MSRSIPIRPTSYNKLGQRTQVQSAPLARERFTHADSDATRVRQLENQVRTLSQATDAARAATTPRVVEVKFTASAEIRDVYVHNFGRAATWRIVDWRPFTLFAIPIFASVPHPNEANLLRIQCGNNPGTIKFEVS